MFTKTENMGIDNNSYVKSVEDLEMNEKSHVSKSTDKVSYEEALDLTGEFNVT